jgi:phage host-nuclease inhibitor protein Gam
MNSAQDPEHEPAWAEGTAISKSGLALMAGCFLAATVWSLAACAWTRFCSVFHFRPNQPTPKVPMNKTTPIPTRPEMETLVREIAALKLEEKLLSARMDEEIQAARGRYEDRLAALAVALAEQIEAARTWAEANPTEFTQRKSIEFAHGVAGFRTGMPRLRTVSKWKWDAVLDALRGSRWGAGYIRVKEEINKEQIIADVGAGVLNAADLRKAGAQVTREEAFYVEPKLTRVAARETVEVA